ncbi:hypothetical protein Pcar_0433 [Syntrophotalea carbinolica DSM 2380]|uniref:Lipoprotein SmpA/OmlA domain-containing protein n=1 Tax=Syntrophotalea carbinolica (strain DSM 2380 / NBRC 103641 / GraBd1) TaxID=338963 RepID=Q3A7F1_SYNC1|nr:hypothetical protein [Syntrophotalea carbinolica]ABA87693.1 hypothetical protein Pcar_0433 [Syntrophotalea carbinolica DSM 2380]
MRNHFILCLRKLLCIFLLATVVACHSPINQKNFAGIETGMAEAEVIALLGEPTETTSIDLGLFSGTAATWRHKDTVISVQFLNGKVQSKQLYRSGQPTPETR